MDTTFHPALDNSDKYTESIELSNKCREFYRKRMENMETSKQRLSPTLRPECKGKKSSIDVAMEKLGAEMVSKGVYQVFKRHHTNVTNLTQPRSISRPLHYIVLKISLI